MTETSPPTAQVALWQRHLTGLPTTWPKRLKEQAADPVVRTAIRNAYQDHANLNDLCVHTGRSRALIRLILVEEKVLRAPGCSQRRSAVLNGHASWLDAAATALRERITDARYPVGSPLPSVRELAAELGVRPWSVHGAIHRLRAEGLLLPVSSYGTVVTDPRHVPDLVATVTVGERTEYWPLPNTGPRRAEQLRRTVLQKLADGTYTPGPRPEVADLAKTLAVPRWALRRALAPLQAHGLLAWEPQGLHVLDHARRRAAALLPTAEEGEDCAA